jgi:hypothetical protein
MSQVPPARSRALQEGYATAQLVWLMGRGLRIAYRAARARFGLMGWTGRYGSVFFAVGVILWVIGCPLWAGRGITDASSGVALVFCLWGSVWVLSDVWDRHGYDVS